MKTPNPDHLPLDPDECPQCAKQTSGMCYYHQCLDEEIQADVEAPGEQAIEQKRRLDLFRQSQGYGFRKHKSN